MRYWLVRVDAPSISLNSKTGNFFVSSRRVPTFKESDVVVYLDKQKQFFGSAKVAGIESHEGRNENLPFKTQISVDSIIEFDKDIDVDFMKYSLSIVKNLKSPNRHFSRGYRLLPKEDYETILNGEAFVARTGFYELVNALPSRMATEFEIEEMSLLPLTGEEKEFHARFSRLYEFIRRRILSVGELIRDVNQQLLVLQLDAYEGAKLVHEFADEDDDYVRGSDIAVQASWFDKLDDALQVSGIAEEKDNITDAVDYILVELRQQDRLPVERRFERVFGMAA